MAIVADIGEVGVEILLGNEVQLLFLAVGEVSGEGHGVHHKIGTEIVQQPLPRLSEKIGGVFIVEVEGGAVDTRFLADLADGDIFKELCFQQV